MIELRVEIDVPTVQDEELAYDLLMKYDLENLFEGLLTALYTDGLEDVRISVFDNETDEWLGELS